MWGTDREERWEIVTWVHFFPVMYGELREWYSLHLPDGKTATWPLQEHESQISKIACGLVVAGNRINSALHMLLLPPRGEDPLHRRPILSSPPSAPPPKPGLPEVNLTLLFPLHCLICPAPNIRSLPSRIASRRAVTGYRSPARYLSTHPHPYIPHACTPTHPNSITARVRDYRHV